MLWVIRVAGSTPEFIKNAYSTGRQEMGLTFDPHQVFSLSYIIVAPIYLLGQVEKWLYKGFTS